METGIAVKLGRRRPGTTNPHPLMGTYRTPGGLPRYPASVDYQAAALANLSNNFGNDKLGDCTVAACAHAEGIWAGNASGQDPEVILTDVLKMYSGVSGYIPGNDATDQGADELSVLNWWRANGLAGRHIDGAVAVNAADPRELALAIWLFGCVVFCAELPWSWTPVAGPGFTWNVAGDPIPTRGHCFLGVGYDQPGVLIDSWGFVSEATPSRITWTAAAHYCTIEAGGSCFAPISRNWLNVRGVAPNGFNLDQLVADASALGVIV